MNEITTKQKTSITEKSLIDFLYVDETRVDSLISQLRDGTPRSVVKMVEDSTGSTKSGKADAKLVAAEYKSENTATKSAEENYDPFHNKIIQLLHDLSLPIQKTLNEPFSKKLVILNGTIKIRDLQSFKSLAPIFLKNQKYFKITKESTLPLKFINDFIQLLSNSIELSLILDNGMKVSGILKEKSLFINQSDIARTYGSKLPGQWYVFGILDYIPSQSQTGFESPEGPQIDKFIDNFTDITHGFYSSSSYSIIPILVYRDIN